MQTAPATGTRRPFTSSSPWSRMPSVRGTPSAYPKGMVAMRDRRGATHRPPYDTGVPTATSFTRATSAETAITGFTSIAGASGRGLTP